MRRSRPLNLSSGLVVIWLVGISLVFASASRAGSCLAPDLQNTLARIERLVFNDDFTGARALADSLIKALPESPFGYLGRATVFLSEMTDAEADLYPKDFPRTIDTIIGLAEKRIGKGNASETAWMYLCIGHARAYRSLWESRFGSFTSALKLGLEARNAYDEGVASDSTVYDLYGGLGMYHYWKSTKAGILRWIGLFRNDRQRGIDELYLAVDSSCLSRYSARHALIWIWLDRKEYDSALTISRELLREFPAGKMFLWPLATAYFKSGDYLNALETFRLLRERVAGKTGNYFNLVECDYHIYLCCEKLGRSDEAAAVLAQLNAYYDAIPDRTRQRQKSKLATMGRAVRF